MDRGLGGLGIGIATGVIVFVFITLALLIAFPIPTLIAIGGLLVLTGIVAAFAGAINKLVSFFEFKKAELGQIGAMTDEQLLGMKSQRTKEMGKTVGIFLLLAVPTLGLSLLVGIPMVLIRYAQERKIMNNQLNSNAQIQVAELGDKEESVEKSSPESSLNKLAAKKESSQESNAKNKRKFKGWRERRRQKMFIEQEKAVKEDETPGSEQSYEQNK